MLASVSAVASAHDIPVDVPVQAFVRPDGRVLRLVVRVPLEAMRDLDYPRRGAGYVDLGRADRALDEAAQVWIADGIDLYEDDARLTTRRIVAARISWLGDPSFTSYEGAIAHVRGARLSPAENLYWNQGLLDVLIEYDIRSAASRFSVDPRWARLGTHVTTVLRFVPEAGVVRAFEYEGDPGLVRLDPRWHQAAWRFVQLGFRHILTGADHLLFLVCLVVPLRRIRPLLAVVTAFTAAHSLTLALAAYGVAPDALWFPPLVETLIAASIVYMGLENIVAGVNGRRRWLVAFAFGLVHGFGFSFALRQTLQFAGSHLLTSLLSFNLGVELGQIVVLLVLVPAIAALFRHVMDERVGTIVLSALLTHTAWHWMIDRAGRLSQFGWPQVGPAALASLLRGLMLLTALAGAAWLTRLVSRSVWKPAKQPPARESADGVHA